jgi:hypothetical protein
MAGKQKVAMAVKQLDEAVPLYGSSSEQGQIIVECLRKLAKLAQPGDVSSQGQINGLQQAMMKAIQSGQTQKQLASPQGGGGAAPGGAPPTPAPAAAA